MQMAIALTTDTCSYRFAKKKTHEVKTRKKQVHMFKHHTFIAYKSHKNVCNTRQNLAWYPPISPIVKNTKNPVTTMHGATRSVSD